MTRWAEALATTLTGVSLSLPELERPDEVLLALAELGWTADRIIAQARSAWACGRPWPHPVPGVADQFGAARWQAALDYLRQRLGLDSTSRVTQRTVLNADERRLLVDRPPHY